MKKKWMSLVLSLCLMISLMPATVMASSEGYTDIPEGNWSVSAVNAAKDYGLMQGTDAGVFGFGSTITKAEFITVLDRMFGWELISPEVPTLSNVTKDQWYSNYVETALSHGVIEPGKTFDPSAPITREEMAVMLVKGLGYDTLSQSAASLGSPFTDVTNNVGYITIAGDIGMTKGTSDTTFSPAVKG